LTNLDRPSVYTSACKDHPFPLLYSLERPTAPGVSYNQTFFSPNVTCFTSPSVPFSPCGPVCDSPPFLFPSMPFTGPCDAVVSRRASILVFDNCHHTVSGTVLLPRNSGYLLCHLPSSCKQTLASPHGLLTSSAGCLFLKHLPAFFSAAPTKLDHLGKRPLSDRYPSHRFSIVGAGIIFPSFSGLPSFFASAGRRRSSFPGHQWSSGFFMNPRRTVPIHPPPAGLLIIAFFLDLFRRNFSGPGVKPVNRRGEIVPFFFRPMDDPTTFSRTPTLGK